MSLSEAGGERTPISPGQRVSRAPNEAAAVLRGRLIESVSANVVAQPLLMVLSVAGSVMVARALGPGALAVVSLIVSVTATVSTTCDLGISKSIPKILPDLSVRFGRTEAMRARQTLLRWKLSLVLVGYAVLVILDLGHVWEGRRAVAYSQWFLILVGMKLVLQVLFENRSQELAASFRMKELARLQVMVEGITPFAMAAAALASRNPYIVVAVSLACALLQVGLLYRLPGYDLDAGDGRAPPATGWTPRHILKRYWPYLGVTYLVFWFNRIVFGLPFTFLVLMAMGFAPAVLGNVAIAVSIVQRGWDIANIPLVSLRSPLVARLHAANDRRRIVSSQSVMVAMVVLISSVLAIGLLALGPVLLNALYGDLYSSAVRWGLAAGAIALAGNFFSLGNAAIRQMERYGPILFGKILAVGAMLAGLLVAAPAVDRSLLPLVVILNYIGGRLVFWLVTDLWADWAVFEKRGLAIKLRGLAGLAAACALILALGKGGAPASISLGVTALLGGGVVFVGVFRVLGGVGTATREVIRGLLGRQLRWVGYLI